MPESSTYRRLAQLIASGAYLGKLPAERTLSVSLGVSRSTLRKALSQLEMEGVLGHSGTRRAQIARALGGAGGMRRIAFIAPAFPSPGTGRLEEALRRTLVGHEPEIHLASLRYRAHDEPLFREAARSCDGVFLLLGSDGADEQLRAALVGPELAPVVCLEQDLSHWGIPSLTLFPPLCVHQVLDQVHALGHRRIGCLNTQPADPVVQANILAWQVWMATHGCAGPLVSEPVVPFEDPLPRAHALMHTCFAAHPGVTAWLCLTPDVARGAIRAIHDAGMTAGREVSVCCIDGQGQEGFLVPSLACIASPDPAPYFDVGLRWMLAGAARVWHGPLRFSPITSRFHAGESLGPVPVATAPIPAGADS
ncbi:MAG: substrate-binding domain-containing protein [Planctomycetes bacterium]|nr:substrate-binding domain-containing protein [Planctomycetota bacterium]